MTQPLQMAAKTELLDSCAQLLTSSSCSVQHGQRNLVSLCYKRTAKAARPCGAALDQLVAVLDGSGVEVAGLSLVLGTAACGTDHVGRVLLDAHGSPQDWTRCCLPPVVSHRLPAQQCCRGHCCIQGLCAGLSNN